MTAVSGTDDRRSPWRVPLLGALGLGVVAAAVQAVHGSFGDGAGLAGLGVAALVLLVHLWASRWRWALSVLLGFLPALLLLVGSAADLESTGDVAVLVGAGTLVSLGTLAACTWAANRWGAVQGRLDGWWRL